MTDKSKALEALIKQVQEWRNHSLNSKFTNEANAVLAPFERTLTEREPVIPTIAQGFGVAMQHLSNEPVIPDAALREAVEWAQGQRDGIAREKDVGALLLLTEADMHLETLINHALKGQSK